MNLKKKINEVNIALLLNRLYEVTNGNHKINKVSLLERMSNQAEHNPFLLIYLPMSLALFAITWELLLSFTELVVKKTVKKNK